MQPYNRNSDPYGSPNFLRIWPYVFLGLFSLILMAFFWILIKSLTTSWADDSYVRNEIHSILGEIPEMEIKDPEYAKRELNRVLKLSGTADYKAEQAQAYYWLSKIHLVENKREEDAIMALSYAQIAKNNYFFVNEPYWEALNYIQLGNVFALKHEVDSVQYYLEQAEISAGEIEDQSKDSLHVLGGVQLLKEIHFYQKARQDNPKVRKDSLLEERIGRIHQAIAYFRGAENLEGESIALRNLGIIHTNSGHFDQADSIFKEANQTNIQLGSDFSLLRSLLSSGKAKTRRFRQSKKLEDFKAALAFYEEAERLPVETKTALYNEIGILYFYGYYYIENPPEAFSEQVCLDKGSTYYYKGIQAAKNEQNLFVLNDIITSLNKICAHTSKDGVDCQTMSAKSIEVYQILTTERAKNYPRALSSLSSFQINDLKSRQESQLNLLILSGIIGLLLIMVLVGIYFTQLRNRYLQRQLKGKLRALAAQMNPHFISNSLNAIEAMISENRNQEASSYLIKFSRLSRMVLGFSQEEMIYLGDEVEMLRQYLDLEQMRMNQGLSYQIHIDEQLEPFAVQIPPMMIQPFVENAIWHGIKPNEGGEVSIRFKTTGTNGLTCTITDDGIGREKARALKKETEHPKMSYSTQIIQERIEVLERQLGARLQIKDLEDSKGMAAGTQVEISFNLITDDENSQ